MKCCLKDVSMCYALMADKAFDEEESKYKRVMNV